MTDIVIRVEHLSKLYRIGKLQQRHDTLRDYLVAAVKSLSPGRDQKDIPQDYLWALRDVSFEVGQGEVVGIIGKNGAGKSTLLKILSRITNPTEGRVRLRGRVGSLLEVGTGFHPELTGRENIYLNGAILGMQRAEIERKFDEIVAFSEIEKFLDTPIKRYSSGMYVRLAFAVAAHLEPEILLVDEVLAVGDAAFQKKCLGKMGDVAKEGRTVIFVSHNMGAIRTLCQTGIFLEEGKVRNKGDVASTVSSYMSGNGDNGYVSHHEFSEDARLPVQLLSICVVNANDELVTQQPHDRPFWIKIKTLCRAQISNSYLALHIHNNDLETLLFSRDFESNEETLAGQEPGIYLYSVQVPASLLVPGTYRLSVHIARSVPAQIIHGADYVCPFEIVDGGSLRAKLGFPWRGKIAVPLKWECHVE